MKYRRVVLLCVLTGAFLLTLLLVSCGAGARLFGSSGSSIKTLPVAAYTGRDVLSQTVQEINEASTLPLPLLTSISIFEPADYELLDTMMGFDFQGEGHNLRFKGFPTNQDDTFLTMISWTSEDFDLFGIKVGDDQAKAIQTLQERGYMPRVIGSDCEFEKNAISVSFEVNDPKADCPVLKKIVVFVPSSYVH
jgi:hypothetical protein